MCVWPWVCFQARTNSLIIQQTLALHAAGFLHGDTGSAISYALHYSGYLKKTESNHVVYSSHDHGSIKVSVQPFQAWKQGNSKHPRNSSGMGMVYERPRVLKYNYNQRRV